MSTRAVTFEEYRALLAEVLKLRRQVAAGLAAVGGGGGGLSPSATVAALDGTGAAGVAATYSRGDHKHADPNRPTDDQKAALAGTGTPSGSNLFVTADTLTGIVPGQKESIELDAGDLHLVGDSAAPGNNKVYGTNASGVKGWKNDPAGAGSGDVVGPGSATDHAIARFDGTTGKIIQNSGPTIPDDGRISNVTDPTGAQDVATKAYTDDAIGDHEADPDAHKGQKRSIEIDAGDLQLVGDVDTPGADMVYGTNASGVRGWKADPAGGGAGLYCEPLTDGDLTQPELVFAGGDVIMVCV